MLQLIIFLLGLSIILLIRNTKKKILYRTILPKAGAYADTVPYLIRYTIIKNKYFSIKIHKALISDPDDLHDHPWNYLSIILWGGYWERTANPNHWSGFNQKWYRPGSILYRKGNRPHKLVIPEGKFSVSLIFVGRRYRDWGYINWVGNNIKETGLKIASNPVASNEDIIRIAQSQSLSSTKKILKELSKREKSWLTPHQTEAEKKEQEMKDFNSSYGI